MQAHEISKGKKVSARLDTGHSPDASVASLTLNYQVKTVASQGAVSDRLAEVLTEVARIVRQSGGFVGHIKSYLSLAGGGCVAMSVVRDQADRKTEGFQAEAPVGSFDVAATAIVYGVAKDELTRLLRLGMAIGFPESAFIRRAPAPKMVTANPKPIMPFRAAAAN
ncbi:hypothetical protein LJB86_02370 [Deltaproteobacteria bacterium OttesenSCG-928-M10]|nr:hypothetical protein [Deltaproteobacteria bacterium OttesenSCG-928-M10]